MSNYDYITAQGLIVPDTAETRTNVEQYWRSQFGADLPVAPETPQGVFITAETLARDASLRLTAEMANQINPDLANDVSLDALGWLFGSERFGASRSVIRGVTVAGVAGTVIQQGRRAVTTAGHEFRTRAGVQIGAGGTASVDFESVETGAIPAITGSLNKIIDNVNGWETVTNPNPATVGRSQESQVAFRKRRRQTLAVNNISIPEAITSALYAIDGVISVAFLENDTNTSKTINGVTLDPHSVWVSVYRRPTVTDATIAETLATNKTAGTGWNGAQTFNYLDPHSGQTSVIKWDVPTASELYIRVTAKNSDLDVSTIVKQSIMAYANGEIEGESGFEVGGEVSPFELSGAINQTEPRITVTKVELSDDAGATWTTSVVAASANEIFTTSESVISVVIV